VVNREAVALGKLSDTEQQALQGRINFLKHVTTGLDIHPDEIAVLASIGDEQYMVGRHVVIQQGREAEKLVFVRSGELRVVRRVPLALVSGDRKARIKRDQDRPRPNVFGMNGAAMPAVYMADGAQQGDKFVQVGLLLHYQFYGHREVLTSEKYRVSLICESVATILVVPRFEFIRRLSRQAQNEFLRYKQAFQWEDFPTDKDLQHNMDQCRRWEHFKEGVRAEACVPPETGPDARLQQISTSSHQHAVLPRLAGPYPVRSQQAALRPQSPHLSRIDVGRFVQHDPGRHGAPRVLGSRLKLSDAERFCKLQPAWLSTAITYEKAVHHHKVHRERSGSRGRSPGRSPPRSVVLEDPLPPVPTGAPAAEWNFHSGVDMNAARKKASHAILSGFRSGLLDKIADQMEKEAIT